MKADFTVFPVMETERLVLRKLTLNDANDMFEMRSNPDMIDFTDGKLDEYLDDTLHFIEMINNGIKKNKWVNWAIIYKDNNRLIGTINIWNLNDEENKAEIGYGIVPKYQGKGLMVEALKAVVNYGLNDMKLQKLEVWTERRNLKSIKLVERLGFRYIKEVSEKGFYKKNQTFNMRVYEISKESLL